MSFEKDGAFVVSKQPTTSYSVFKNTEDGDEDNGVPAVLDVSQPTLPGEVGNNYATNYSNGQLTATAAATTSNLGLFPLRDHNVIKVKQRIRMMDIMALWSGCEV